MDWLAKFVASLPLDSISDALSDVTNWWGQAVSGIAPDMLPIYAYVGFSVIVLLLWLLVVRVLPRPLGGVSWLLVLAVLLTPTLASSDTGDVAPASIAVVYALLMKDMDGALRNLLPILVVFATGLFLGFVWQVIKGIINTNNQSRQRSLAAAGQAKIHQNKIDADTEGAPDYAGMTKKSPTQSSKVKEYVYQQSKKRDELKK